MKGYFRKRHQRGCAHLEDKDKKCDCQGKWSFTIDVGEKEDGTRDQRTQGGYDTKGKAQDAAAELHHEITKGTYIDETDILFTDFADQWLTIYEQTHSVKPSTLYIRKHEAKSLKKCFPRLKLKDITKRQYQEALTKLKSSGLSNNTLKGIHSVGRMIFAKAAEFDMIKINPTQYARLPRSQKTVEQLESETELPKFLEKEQLARFLAEAKASRYLLDYQIFITLAYTGLRAGELVALKWKDIDADKQTISITKTYFNPTNKTTAYQLLTPKTSRSRRIIDVDRIVIDALEKWRTRQNTIRMKHRDIYLEEDFIFTKFDKNPGYPEHVIKIENRMRRLLKLAGLNDKLTPHSLRHTHTSLLAEAGVGLQEIMERLGHSNDSTTRNIYMHVTKDKKKEAAQKFSSLMNGL